MQSLDPGYLTTPSEITLATRKQNTHPRLSVKHTHLLIMPHAAAEACAD